MDDRKGSNSGHCIKKNRLPRKHETALAMHG
jgi:hypothetical protein